jgi:hypothetical protein
MVSFIGGQDVRSVPLQHNLREIPITVKMPKPVPGTIRAQPSKNSQMTVISKNQNIQSGDV